MMKVLTCENSAKSLESPDVNVGELGEALELFSANFLFFLLCLKWRQEGISFLSKWGLKHQERSAGIQWRQVGSWTQPQPRHLCMQQLRFSRQTLLGWWLTRQHHAWMSQQIAVHERRPGWLNGLVSASLIEQMLRCLTNWLTASEQLIWHMFNHICQSVIGGGPGQTIGRYVMDTQDLWIVTTPICLSKFWLSHSTAPTAIWFSIFRNDFLQLIGQN